MDKRGGEEGRGGGREGVMKVIITSSDSSSTG